MLLAEVTARLHAVEQPIVRFMPACQSAVRGDVVSRVFAAAAAARLGRTLLVHTASGSDEGALAGRTNRKQRKAPAVIPDADTPGLYHRQMSELSIESIMTETQDTQQYRMIVVQSAAPSICPFSLSRARHCHGTILTVAAGVTRLRTLQATASQVSRAGGMVLGVVLFDAPAMRLPFNFGCRS